MTKEIDSTNNADEIAHTAIISRMSTTHRKIVFPSIRPRFGRYKASKVEQAFREVSVQVDDLQNEITQEVLQILSTIITEVHRETQRVREAAELEELKMRQQLQQDRDLLEQQRQATMETTKNEARSIMNAAQQESDKVDKKINELRRMIAEVSAVIEYKPDTSS
jgi:vacuolar-type H+-ATPase subunit I/STV1